MTGFIRLIILAAFTILVSPIIAQDTLPIEWKVSSRKINANEFELSFSSPGNPQWHLYAPNQLLFEIPTTTLELPDSSFQLVGNLIDSGNVQSVPSALFDGQKVKIYQSPTIWKQIIRINGDVPANLTGAFQYTYGSDEAFYPSTVHQFTIPLEGGISSNETILVNSIDLKNPVNGCGDDEAADKSMLTIFFLGFIGGLIALITPCVFPLIPLTVSFFTKRSGTRKRGLRNAFLYGFSIFAIYALLSIPFHLLDSTNPEILNNISTNVTLNILFFVIFIVFALSFFGLYEIGLPSSFANRVDSKSGIGDIAGIFFMALTLAIVSFSCTGPILGSLLAGTLTNNSGAWQLTFGMGGFGLGLALPFALFALFPGWLQSLPKSGGWLTDVKVVLGFLELAMAVKFLSNADLVKQWGLLPREVFIGIWIIIGILIILYLLGALRLSKGPKPIMSPVRIVFVVLFGAFTLYLVPGLTNTKWSNLSLISGFPPPLSYSLYEREITIDPIHNDYQKAVKLAKEQNKPILIDFTGWACVNCRRMEENVWIDKDVESLMKDSFVVVSLYVDERQRLPAAQQMEYTTKTGDKKQIITVGDKWATFQAENFNAVSQPQYAILSPDEKALTRTKSYTPDPEEFKEWLQCGLQAYSKQ